MGHVAIIGAGIIGLAAAYELQRRGRDVTIIDPREPGSAASSGNTGWVVPVLSAPIPAPGLPVQVARWMLKKDSPFRVDVAKAVGLAPWLARFWWNCSAGSYARGLKAMGPLTGQSYSGFERWRAEGLSFEWLKTGVLFAASDPAYIEHLITDVEAIRDSGFEPVEWLTTAQLAEEEPRLSALVTSGVLAPHEQIVRPEEVTGALVSRLKSEGARFIQAPVEGPIACSGSFAKAIVAGGERVAADHFLIAAGAWTGSLARKFGANVPVIGGKGYSITVENPELELKRPLYLADAKIACTPFRDGIRFAGMMELTGTDDAVEAGRLMTMVRALDHYLPGWERGSRRVSWAGLRPMTPDGLPVLGSVPNLDNVLVASGHGMLGITLAPITGKIVADLIVDGRTDVDIGPFSPARFQRFASRP